MARGFPAQMNELLAELFSSKVRASVLAHMLPRPRAAMSLTEFSRLLNLPISSLQHECYKLERIGVIKGRREGSSRRYRVNQNCFILPQLTALIVAAIGQREALSASLADIEGLQAAFIGTALPLDGMVAGTTPADLKIPLVLIGEIALEDVESSINGVAQLLGISASGLEGVFYLPGDWAARLQQHQQYAVWLMSGPRTDLIGDPLRITTGENGNA